MGHIVIHEPPEDHIVDQKDKCVCQKPVGDSHCQYHFVETNVRNPHGPENAVLPSVGENGVIYAVHNVKQADDQQNSGNAKKE